MNIRDILKRRKCYTNRRGTGGVTGVQMSSFWYPWTKPISRIRRTFPRHMLILMEVGSVAFRRDGQTSFAQAGDVLLVPAAEGELELIPSQSPEGLRGMIVEFDSRSIAKILRNSFAAEHAAIQSCGFRPSGLVFPRLAIRCFPPVEGIEHPSFDPVHTFEIIFDELSNQTAGFARSVFYEDRWRLLEFMERQVSQPLSDFSWIDDYTAGGKQLEKDCQFYVGCSPKAFVKRRKIEIASAWLRCGRSVNEIARVLGFCSAWEFQCLYGATTKRRCADVQAETPLSWLSSEELREEIVPFWWSMDRRLPGRRPTEVEREFHAALGRAIAQSRRPLETRGFARQLSRIPEDQLEEMDQAEETAREALLARAEEFFDMQTTAAEIVVPFFKDNPIRFRAAA